MLEHVARRPVSAPTAEPFHVDEVRHRLRIGFSDDDNDLRLMIAAARQHVERKTGQSLLRQSWDVAYDDFPHSDHDGFRLPGAPLRAVSSVTYHDEDLSTSSTFSSSSYQVDVLKMPPELVLKDGEGWPTDDLRESSGVVIRTVEGYEVPCSVDADSDVVTATGHWFSDGDLVRIRASGGSGAAVPDGLAADTDYYVRDVSGDTLKLAATSGGTAIDLTTTGTGSLFIGPEHVPAILRAYMLLLIGAMYEHREMEVTGTISTKIKYASGMLDDFVMDWF